MFDDAPEFRKCTNENQFKRMYLKGAGNASKFVCFCIETESTVKGFPDVLCINKENGQASFLEFKVAKSGMIKFESNQPAFYRKYARECAIGSKDSFLEIAVVAYNFLSGRLHFFMVHELFDKDSPYCITRNNTVDLTNAEKMITEDKEKKVWKL